MVGEINGMRRDLKYISIWTQLEPHVHQGVMAEEVLNKQGPYIPCSQSGLLEIEIHTLECLGKGIGYT